MRASGTPGFRIGDDRGCLWQHPLRGGIRTRSRQACDLDMPKGSYRACLFRRAPARHHFPGGWKGARSPKGSRHTGWGGDRVISPPEIEVDRDGARLAFEVFQPADARKARVAAHSLADNLRGWRFQAMRAGVVEFANAHGRPLPVTAAWHPHDPACRDDKFVVTICLAGGMIDPKRRAVRRRDCLINPRAKSFGYAAPPNRNRAHGNRGTDHRTAAPRAALTIHHEPRLL